MTKGQITVQLTWIFALLAGIAVVGLILFFIDTQQEESEVATSITILDYVDSSIRSVAKTQNTFNKIKTANIRLKVLCEDRETSGLMLDGAENIKQTRYQAIFSPENLEGREFLAWTKDWNLPNNIDRFVYLATPEVLFVIVQDQNGQDYWKKFRAGFPSDYESINITRQTRSITKNYDEYKFVFFGEQAAVVSAFSMSQLGLTGKKISAVNLRPTNVNDLSRGAAEFYTVQNDKFQLSNPVIPYMGYALLYGAAFSEHVETYKCNLDKALFRLELMTELNENRTLELMKNLAGSNPACLAWIPNFSNVLPGVNCHPCLRIMKDLPTEYGKILQSLPPNLNPNNIAAAAIEIGRIERDMKKGRNCPTL